MGGKADFAEYNCTEALFCKRIVVGPLRVMEIEQGRSVLRINLRCCDKSA